jgi:putative PIN family toxin of toxin-antitoxin system
VSRIPLALVDTNVVVAGLLTKSEISPAARILDGMLSARFPFVLSEQVLAEYRAVLVRKKLQKLHGLSASETDALLIEIVQHAIVLVPLDKAPAAPEHGDQLLWNLLAARSDLHLVTGDKLLLAALDMKGRVLTPAQFAALMP